MTQEQKPLQFVVTHPKDLSASGILNYICEANAEIRRLQGENESLKQQLADAPSWGESKRAMEVCKIDEVRDAGIYEFKHTDGSTSVMSIGLDSNKVFESFRRLNYEPQPAREVEPPEKKYNLLGYHVTVAEMAEWRGNPDLNMPNIGELARDLLAAQARIRELEGK